MELKVIVNGLERLVAGLTENTTCAQLIYALAYAYGQKGRFALVEKFGDCEQNLAPTECLHERVKKAGGDSSKLVFILKQLEDCSLNSAPINKQLCESNNLSPSLSILSINDSADAEVKYLNSDNPNKYMQSLSSFGTITHIQCTQNMNTYKEKDKNSYACHSASTSMLRNGLPPQSNRLPEYNQNISTTSLPIYNRPIKYRPPPPAYHEAICKRHNSLHKKEGTLIHMETDVEFSQQESTDRTMNGSVKELEDLIEKQRIILEQQNLILAGLTTNEEKEILQLERQQANLRKVLLPLRQANLREMLESELNRLKEVQRQIHEAEETIFENRRKIVEADEARNQMLEEFNSLRKELDETDWPIC